MAGIIAGRDAAATTLSGNSSDFVGMAPDSRIVSIKVADAKGQTDVSQAIAAIDWVVENRNKNGLNIRVLNMSFGTDGVAELPARPAGLRGRAGLAQGHRRRGRRRQRGRRSRASTTRPTTRT